MTTISKSVGDISLPVLLPEDCTIIICIDAGRSAQAIYLRNIHYFVI